MNFCDFTIRTLFAYTLGIFHDAISLFFSRSSESFQIIPHKRGGMPLSASHVCMPVLSSHQGLAAIDCLLAGAGMADFEFVRLVFLTDCPDTGPAPSAVSTPELIPPDIMAALATFTFPMLPATLPNIFPLVPLSA
jgi:hypothetical protein